MRYNYRTFSNQRIAWGGGHGQSSVQSFDLHNDVSDIEMIKMYLRLDCPSGGCDPWDRYANIMVKDKITNEWFEIGRHITPYGVDNNALTRGLEFDVTDFKGLLEGNVELRIFVETWVSSGWIVSLEFDYTPGTPDYKYYKVSKIIQYNGNSLGGVPYGGLNGNTEIDLEKFDLIKSLQFGSNIESAHIRTIVTGWGHATPADSDGRACAEWCFRTHKIKIDNSNLFSHYMGPIGCSQNPINNQGGNWAPDRAGWCPGMTVPVRIDKFGTDVSNKNMNYDQSYMTKALSDFVVKNKLSKLILAGESIGGVLCATVASVLPKRVERIFVFNPYDYDTFFGEGVRRAYRFARFIIWSMSLPLVGSLFAALENKLILWFIFRGGVFNKKAISFSYVSLLSTSTRKSFNVYHTQNVFLNFKSWTESKKCYA